MDFVAEDGFLDFVNFGGFHGFQFLDPPINKCAAYSVKSEYRCCSDMVVFRLVKYSAYRDRN